MQPINAPWPWYVAGPIIAFVSTMLAMFGKSFGISSSLRHICAACMPAEIPFFSYNWKKEQWNLFFVLGILIGGVLAQTFISNPNDVLVHTDLKANLSSYGIHDFSGLVPADIFNWSSLLTLKGFILMVVGGFLVGFGTRYAGGCTSGHAIMGLSNLQWPSLAATICFMIGGFIMTWLILPYILRL